MPGPSNQLRRMEDISIKDEYFSDLDETCDGDEDVSNAYHAKSWPDDFPTGYLYKGKKKAFVAVDTLMKKGNKRTSDNSDI